MISLRTNLGANGRPVEHHGLVPGHLQEGTPLRLQLAQVRGPVGQGDRTAAHVVAGDRLLRHQSLEVAHRLHRAGEQRARPSAPTRLASSANPGLKPGRTNPPFLPLAPDPTSSRSSTTTEARCRARVRAADSPGSPPTTATSAASGSAAMGRPATGDCSRQRQRPTAPLRTGGTRAPVLPRQPVREIDQQCRHQEHHRADRVDGRLDVAPDHAVHHDGSVEEPEPDTNDVMT